MDFQMNCVNHILPKEKETKNKNQRNHVYYKPNWFADEIQSTKGKSLFFSLENGKHPIIHAIYFVTLHIFYKFIVQTSSATTSAFCDLTNLYLVQAYTTHIDICKSLLFC